MLKKYLFLLKFHLNINYAVKFYLQFENFFDCVNGLVY